MQKVGNEIDVLQFLNKHLLSTMIAGVFILVCKSAITTYSVCHDKKYDESAN
jgi:hypothetical protein